MRADGDLIGNSVPPEARPEGESPRARQLRPEGASPRARPGQAETPVKRRRPDRSTTPVPERRPYLRGKVLSWVWSFLE
eukprot:6760280-Heterocapsa_arctica.AAC.1